MRSYIVSCKFVSYGSQVPSNFWLFSCPLGFFRRRPKWYPNFGKRELMHEPGEKLVTFCGDHWEVEKVLHKLGLSEVDNSVSLVKKFECHRNREIWKSSWKLHHRSPLVKQSRSTMVSWWSLMGPLKYHMEHPGHFRRVVEQFPEPFAQAT